MDVNVQLLPAAAFGGKTGWQDCSSYIFTVLAKESIYASAEQTKNLEDGLYVVYKAYLESVASTNNGRY